MEGKEEGGRSFVNTLTRVLTLDWPEGAGIDDVIWVCFPGAKGQEGTVLYASYHVSARIPVCRFRTGIHEKARSSLMEEG